MNTYRYVAPDSVSFRGEFEFLPGVLASQRRLIRHSERLFPAFDSLDIMGVEAALDFVERPLEQMVGDEDHFEGVVGVLLSFGILCVEAERERVREAEMT